MSKHTPGPWEARQHKIWTQDAPVHIADIIRAPDGDWSPANARLIAAAPDLLEALSLLVADIDTQGLNVDPAYRRLACDAIAKAKGEGSD